MATDYSGVLYVNIWRCKVFPSTKVSMWRPTRLSTPRVSLRWPSSLPSGSHPLMAPFGLRKLWRRWRGIRACRWPSCAVPSLMASTMVSTITTRCGARMARTHSSMKAQVGSCPSWPDTGWPVWLRMLLPWLLYAVPPSTATGGCTRRGPLTGLTGASRTGENDNVTWHIYMYASRPFEIWQFKAPRPELYLL